MRRTPRRSRKVLAWLVAVTLLLLVVDVVSGPGGFADRTRGVAAVLLGPAERAASATGRSLADAGRGLAGRTRRDADALRRENDALRLALQTSEDDRRRADELDALLHTAGLGQYRMVPARVIAMSGSQAERRLVTLDAGSRDGIRADRTVLSGRGLVGRVVRVAPTSCEVLLVTDRTFSVGVRLEGSGLIGVASGSRSAPMRLRLLDAQTRVDVGSRLVTLGSAGGSPFVPGVPVGLVHDVRTAPGTLSRTGTVTPFVAPATLDLVGVVVQPPRTDPRDAVLPPRPTGPPPAAPAATTAGSR